MATLMSQQTLQPQSLTAPECVMAADLGQYGHTESGFFSLKT